MNKSIVALLVVIAIIAIGGYIVLEHKSFGGTTNYDTMSVSELKVGVGCNNGFGICTGSSITSINAGSCTIWAPATTIAASTTQQVECQSATNGSLASGLAGLTANSICQIRMASSTNTTSNGLVLGGASASSTAGSIVVQLSNLTGTTFTWTATASSSAKWNYFCVN